MVPTYGTYSHQETDFKVAFSATQEVSREVTFSHRALRNSNLPCCNPCNRGINFHDVIKGLVETSLQ